MCGLLSVVCCLFFHRNKFASITFFMCKNDALMFWGGEYTKQMDLSNQRQNVALPNGRRLLNAANRQPQFEHGRKNPTFEFRVVSGAPFTSR